jgi:hypothetical protein
MSSADLAAYPQNKLAVRVPARICSDSRVLALLLGRCGGGSKKARVVAEGGLRRLWGFSRAEHIATFVVAVILARHGGPSSASTSERGFESFAEV